jgi:hypothetical protein
MIVGELGVRRGLRRPRMLWKSFLTLEHMHVNVGATLDVARRSVPIRWGVGHV